MRKLEVSAADLKNAHAAVAASLVPGIAMRTPRRTGALAGSWAPGSTKTRARLTSPKPYAGVIEYGWSERGIEPARMIRDTVEANTAEILAAYERELEKLARDAGFGVK
jgi:hypothetical protein